VWDTRDLRLARWGIALRHHAAEWSLSVPGADEGAAAHLGPIEVTFTGGPSRPPEAALDLVRAFTRHAPLAPRAPGLNGAAPELIPADLKRTAHAGEAVQRALSASVIRLLRHDPGVRLSRDPEDVHQARVATRRLRSDLRTFGPLLDPEWTKGLRDELRWLGGELGRVRDAEVLRDRLRASVQKLPEPDQAAGAEVVAPLSYQVRSARQRLLRAMRSERYLDLLDRLIAAARSPALLDTAAAPAEKVVPRLVRRPWRNLLAGAESSKSTASNEQLHELRIRAKRCRYAAEAAAAVVGKPAANFARAVADLQEVLGELHDAVVAEAWLRERSASPKLPDGCAFAAGELVSVQRDAAEASRASWPRVWRRVAAKGMSAWIK
jgi:CHAD domain-containing protein